jgi:hypothetical protein
MSGLGIVVVTGGRFTATLDDPGNLPRLGARVEVPVTRAVVSAWQTAVLADGLWVVALDAPLDDGYYNLVWRSPEEPPVFEAYIPLQSSASQLPSTDWPAAEDNKDELTPEVDDVARLIRTRTVGMGSGEEGSFNDGTRPTEEEARQEIEEAVDDVLAELRDNFDPRHYSQVRRVVAFYAAMIIERSYYPESSREAGGTLPWQSEYREALAALKDKIETDNLIGDAGPMQPILS